MNCAKLLILLNISCQLNLDITPYVVFEMKSLNPTSLTVNNLFLLMVMFLIKSLIKPLQKGSVLGLLLFSIYINDLNHAIKFCKFHDFADDTNLVHFSK